jgi:hypothetical protein
MERARQSDTWTLAAADARPWLLMMWATAWEQTPCGSLPNDDELIAARIGMPAKAFAKMKPILLRKWWLADDGRLYHDVLVQRVTEMMDKRKTDADRKRGFDAKVGRIKARDEGACVYCGSTTYLHIDHLIPRAAGGTHEDTNLVCACRRCNTKKGARTPDQAGMSFVNDAARLMWEELKKNEPELVRNASVMRSSRVTHKRPTTPEPEPVPDEAQECEGRARTHVATDGPEDPVPLGSLDGFQPTPGGAACIAIREAGIGAVNPSHPDLRRLLDAGVTPQDLAATAAELVAKGKGSFPLLLATVDGRLVRRRWVPPRKPSRKPMT